MIEPGAQVSARWATWRAAADLDEYATRWQRQAADGHEVHGEADLVASLTPATVLDAGCGAGRVATELSRRGIDVVGVDLDDDLLAHAHRLAPELDWRCADLATLALGRRFDVIVQAGNVLNFCRPEDRSAIVAASAAHLLPGGRLVVGFGIEPEPDSGRTNLDRHLDHAAAAGLDLEARWSAWDRKPFTSGSDYVVVMHRRAGGAARRSGSGPAAGEPGSG